MIYAFGMVCLVAVLAILFWPAFVRAFWSNFK